LAAALNFHCISFNKSVYMPLCGKVLGDIISPVGLLSIVSHTDNFLGSGCRTRVARRNQCGWLFLSPALILRCALVWNLAGLNIC
jgi:hypothetical protein